MKNRGIELTKEAYMAQSELAIFKEEMKQRTNNFAHDCIKFSFNLPNNTPGDHIRGQLIGCSTSLAANYRVSSIAQTIPMIVSKLSITIEEADESEFWLEFSVEEKLKTNDRAQKLIRDAYEISSILIKS